MAKEYKVGQKLTNEKGEKVVITSILPNGAATLNYAAGSGKTGYAGVISGNMLTKYGFMPFSNFRIKEIEAGDLTWEDTNFSYEDYENYVQEKDGDEASALEQALLESRELNLKDIDQRAFSELENEAEFFNSREERNVDGTRHRREFYNVYRWMIEKYSKAYGASEEFNLARAKTSLLYQLSSAAGTRSNYDGKKDGYDFSTAEGFGEAFTKAVAIAKNPNSSYGDIFNLLGSYGMCPYSEYPDASHGNHADCQRKFAAEQSDPEVTWPLPPVRF